MRALAVGALVAGACAPVPEARVTVDTGGPGSVPVLAPLDPLLAAGDRAEVASAEGSLLRGRAEALGRTTIDPPGIDGLAERGAALRRNAERLRQTTIE